MSVQSYHARLSFRGRTVWAKAVAFLTLLIVVPHLFAQTSAISGSIAPMALFINILEGEDALNNIHDRTAREPIVQVTDENHKPVKGAYVTFTDVAGATGAGATFGGLLTYSAVTDADGKAVGRGFKPNGISGEHKVEVAAALGMLVAAIIFIHEKNVGEIVPITKPEGAGLGHSLARTGAFFGEFAGGATALGLYLGFKTDSSAASSALNAGTPAVPATPVSVPEIDPSLAFGCLALLAGGVAVLRGRSNGSY